MAKILVQERSRIVLASAVTLAVLLSAGIAALSATAAPKTTAPGIVHYVPVVVTDSSLKIQRDAYTVSVGKAFGVKQVYPRGVVIRFVFHNEGKLPHTVRLKLLSHHYFGENEAKLTVIYAGMTPIKAQQTRSLSINFYYRGSFALQTLTGKKITGSEGITIL